MSFDPITLEVGWNRLIGVVINGMKPPRAKAEHVLDPAARVELRLPGGGGYGDPARRAPDLVSRDLEAGYVSASP